MSKTHKRVGLSSMLLTIGILSGVYTFNSFLNDYSKASTQIKEDKAPVLQIEHVDVPHDDK